MKLRTFVALSTLLLSSAVLAQPVDGTVRAEEPETSEAVEPSETQETEPQETGEPAPEQDSDVPRPETSDDILSENGENGDPATVEPPQMPHQPDPEPPETQPPVEGPAPAMTVWRVHSGANRAYGFVAPGHARYLITSAHVLRHRGSVSVSREGFDDSHDVEIVSVAGGIALLRLPVAGGPMLETSSASAGTAYSLSNRPEETGIVLATNRRRRHHHRGGTFEVTTCAEGAAMIANNRVVGVCTSANSAANVEAIETLFEGAREVRGGTADRSSWRVRLSADLLYRIREGFGHGLGFQVGLGVVGWDRLGFALRGGFVLDAELDGTPNSVIGTPYEGTAEVQLHQAFRLGLPMRLVLAAGVNVRSDRTTVTTTFTEFPTTCDPMMGPCEVVRTETEVETSELKVLPIVRAEYNVGSVSFAYSATIDIDVIENTLHTFAVGLVY